jgi:hypothetical protein
MDVTHAHTCPCVAEDDWEDYDSDLDYDDRYDWEVWADHVEHEERVRERCILYVLRVCKEYGVVQEDLRRLLVTKSELDVHPPH